MAGVTAVGIHRPEPKCDGTPLIKAEMGGHFLISICETLISSFALWVETHFSVSREQSSDYISGPRRRVQFVKWGWGGGGVNHSAGTAAANSVRSSRQGTFRPC